MHKDTQDRHTQMSYNRNPNEETGISSPDGLERVTRDSRQHIRAVVRLRPVIKDDNELAKMLRMSPEVCAHVRADGQSIQLKKDSFESRQFRVDHAFGPVSSQREVYDIACKDIIDDFLRGYNGFIMAYGQVFYIALIVRIYMAAF